MVECMERHLSNNQIICDIEIVLQKRRTLDQIYHTHEERLVLGRSPFRLCLHLCVPLQSIKKAYGKPLTSLSTSTKTKSFIYK